MYDSKIICRKKILVAIESCKPVTIALNMLNVIVMP